MKPTQPNPISWVGFWGLVGGLGCNFILGLGLGWVQVNSFFNTFDSTRPTIYISLFYYYYLIFILIYFGILRIIFDEFENSEYNLCILYEL